MFLYQDGKDFGLTFEQYCKRYPQVSFPDRAQIEGCYSPRPQPQYNPDTHTVREVRPVNGIQQWELVPRDPAEIEREQAQEVASKIEQLWSAADQYVSGYISGVAVGILTMGVLRELPKCTAVSTWSSGVWADYYRRKAAVAPGVEIDTDFSSHGSMPHSVPELQQEVGL